MLTEAVCHLIESSSHHRQEKKLEQRRSIFFVSLSVKCFGSSATNRTFFGPNDVDYFRASPVYQFNRRW